MRSVLVLVAALAGSLPAVQAGGITGFLDALSPQPELKVVTVTDVTPAGAQRAPASPTQPVYYVAISAGFRDFGAALAGERMIRPPAVTQAMIKVLAKQGYLPATEQHPPSVVLVWTWGTMNVKILSFDGSYPQQVNRGQLLDFLGGEKVGLHSGRTLAFEEEMVPGLMMLSNAATELRDAAADHLYVAKVAAYDFAAARERKPVLLWATKISAPARGFWLPEVLPSMLVIASPFFGRETDRPVWIAATEKFRPEVTLGEPRFVQYTDQGSRAVIEVPRASRTAPGGRNGKP